MKAAGNPPDNMEWIICEPLCEFEKLSRRKKKFHSPPQ
jgi:hypothetical protein